MKLICRFGVHNWVRIYAKGPKKVDRCSHCGACRSTMYDMTYGETYWIPGDCWSPVRVK